LTPYLQRIIWEKKPDNGNIPPELLVLLPNPILFLHSESQFWFYYIQEGKKMENKNPDFKDKQIRLFDKYGNHVCTLTQSPEDEDCEGYDIWFNLFSEYFPLEDVE
jgi:hypothetical protein